MITIDNINYFPIPNYEKYFISKDGKIFSTLSKKFIKYNINKKGYYRCWLYKNKKSCSFLVHRLVLLTFKDPSNLETRHIDNNKLNNNINNLCYGTAKQNTNDKFTHNRKFQKLNYSTALEIAQDKRPYKYIAKEYGITYSSVSDIKCGCAWSIIPKKYRFQRGRKTFKDYLYSTFTQEQINFILDKNNSRKYISNKLNISIEKIASIRKQAKTKL